MQIYLSTVLVCEDLQPAGAAIEASNVPTWAANDTAKLGLQHPGPYWHQHQHAE
jgi:hypothetical protein